MLSTRSGLDDLSLTDIFCGAGGASSGLAKAGWTLKLGANHWNRAIETHAANFPDAEHLVADVSNYDMRRLPRTRALWASPICTEVSPANGAAKRNTHGQLDLLEQDGHVSKEALVRTRATAFDVIRATEVHRYDAVMVENVPNFVTKWDLFPHWFAMMETLGYNGQVVSVSSAHIYGEGNAPAPQWRDRLYVVFTRKGIPLPDLEPRPLAFCGPCGEVVHARQWWKKNPRWRAGQYLRQYVYVCPNAACRHSVVEPYVLPAAAAIDWSDLGQRIGDREKPLAPSTMRRIRTGLELFAAPANPVMLNVNHGADEDGRQYPIGARPLGARTTKIGDGFVTPAALVPAGGTWNDLPSLVDDPMRTRLTREAEGLMSAPFIAELRGGGSTARSVEDPMATLTASGTHHGLTVPPGAFVQKHHGGMDYAGVRHMVKSPREPLATIVGAANMSLVVPFRKGNPPHRAGERPLSTLTTVDTHSLVTPVDPDDCYFRMLQPREHARGQRFEDDYVILGNKGEQTKQAGNAVSANVSQWVGQQVAAVLA